MIAFDADVLTEILLGTPEFVDRAKAIPKDEQSVPAVALEEVIRGRLHGIRLAEGKKGKLSLEEAYRRFTSLFVELCYVRILEYTREAEETFQRWTKQKVRVSTHDLRIAATCVTQSVTLVSRNRRHFERVPGLMVQFWG